MTFCPSFIKDKKIKIIIIIPKRRTKLEKIEREKGQDLAPAPRGEVRAGKHRPGREHSATGVFVVAVCDVSPDGATVTTHEYENTKRRANLTEKTKEKENRNICYEYQRSEKNGVSGSGGGKLRTLENIRKNLGASILKE